MKKQKLLICALCACLVMSMTGCAIKSPATVLTVDDVEISAGVYLLQQYQAYSNAISEISGAESQADATIDDMPWKDWVHEQTITAARNYAWVEKEFEAQGFSFTDEELTALEKQSADNYASNEDALVANGIGADSYKQFYLNNAKFYKIYDAFAEENPVPQDESQAYMQDTYTRAAILSLPLHDATYASVSSEKIEEIQALATEMADDVTAGADFEEAAEKALKAAYEICGLTYTEDAMASSNSAAFFTEDSTSYPPDMIELVCGLAMDEAAMYDYYSSVMVLQRQELYTDDDEYETEYEQAISDEINSAAFNAKVTEESALYSVTEDASAVSAYSIDKIV